MDGAMADPTDSPEPADRPTPAADDAIAGAAVGGAGTPAVDASNPETGGDAVGGDLGAAPETGPGVRRRRAVRRVRTATRQLVDSAEELAEALGGAVVVTAGGAISDTLVPAAEALARRVGRRRQGYRLRRHPEQQPLPNLYRVHPEARLAPVRELGLLSIPTEEIVGTAVEGADQRGLDFKPLPAFRSVNWIARWQRLKAATDRLATLPPIDVLKTPEGYWVVDGHNRVAVALDNGQVDVDADVRVVVLPGQGPVRPAGPLAPVLVDSAGLQSTRRAARMRKAPKETQAGGGTDAGPDDGAAGATGDAGSPSGDAGGTGT
jgi:hypothetical protein